MTNLITDSQTLKDRLKPMADEPYITVDTEFIREKTYYPQLCLVQVAGKNDAFAFDPMAKNIDLSPFLKMLGDKKLVKVFHSCTQDLEIFYNITGKVPASVFDTQVAAQILGYGESISYGNLVKELLDEEVDKSVRHSDWAARPLSKQQIEYAISDVTHLREVYEMLLKKLKEKGREKWVEEEMEPILSPSFYENDPKDAWKRIKLRSKKKEFVKQVAALARWREERAQKIDKPRNWVMKADSILEIAHVSPRTPEDLQGLRFYEFKRNPELTEEILNACKQGRRMLLTPKVEKKAPLPKGTGPLMELLKVLLRAQCDHHDVAPSVVAKVSDLEEIARETRPDVPCMHGWRYEIFGKFAEQLKRGDLAITAHGGKIVLIEPAIAEE